MSLLFWVVLCVLGYFITDLIPMDATVGKIIKVLAVIGLVVCLVLSIRS